VLDGRAWRWLVLGAALIAASQLRFGVGVLAWIAPIPFLRYARLRPGARGGAGLALASLVGWVAALAKIVTPPVPPVLAVAFALPVWLFLTLPYLAMPVLRRLGERVAVLAFAAWMVAGEWTLHAALPFGTWGSAANTQLDGLALLQLASVTGLHGVSFLLYVVSASLESLAAAPSRARLRFASAWVIATVAVASAGQVRLARAAAIGGAHTLVAAVGTDSTIGAGPIPGEAQLASIEEGLFARTRRAAASGAKLVVWTEAATLVRPEGEASFLARVGALARAEEIAIAAGYVVPVSTAPLRYENRYALFGPDGRLDHVYDKHHPVPGEPAEAGKAPMPLYVSDTLGRLSGAICYDYDFPRLGLQHAALDLDLVVLPSSDWRGIDPSHTEMAGLRAIEGGHSVLRSTRFGLSAGIDPYGRMRGSLSHFDDRERVLVVSLPRHGVRTVYGVVGDVFPITCVALGLGALAAATLGRRWYAPRRWTRSSPSRAAPSSKPASG